MDGEVDIGFIHNYDSVEGSGYPGQLFFRETVAGRVVRRTDENELSVFIRSGKERGFIEREILH